MLFANSWQVVGSFMYFTGVSSHFLIFGRLICGVGMYIFKKKLVLVWFRKYSLKRTFFENFYSIF